MQVPVHSHAIYTLKVAYIQKSLDSMSKRFIVRNERSLQEEQIGRSGVGGKLGAGGWGGGRARTDRETWLV